MRRERFGVSSLLASTLVVGSLGICAVTATADDRGAPARQPRQKAVQVDKAVDSTVASKGVIANVSTRAKSQLLGAHLSKDGMLTGRLNVSDSLSGAHVAAEN